MLKVLGCPPLKAMACGTPVVTTDCKGNRDYAKDKYNCLMANLGDYNALSNSVRAIMVNEEAAEKLKVGGIETAGIWTWDKTVDKFEDAIGAKLQR